MSLILEIDAKYMDKFYALPESELKTKTFHSLLTKSSLGKLPTDHANYLQENLLSDSKDAFILDLLKTYDLKSSDNRTSFGEAGISIKKGWH